MTDQLYDLKWGSDVLPQLETLTTDVQPIQHQQRMWNSALRVDMRGYKRKANLTWDGLTQAQMTEITDAWQKYAAIPTLIEFPTGVSYFVLGSDGGMGGEPRYNPLLRHWRYKMRITVEEV